MADFPTALAARQCFTGDPTGCVNSLLWTLSRAAMLAGGMWLAGERDKLWQRGLAGSTAIETFVFLWSAFHLDEKVATLPSATAVLSGDARHILATYLLRSSMVWGGLHLAGLKQNALRDALAGTALIELSVLSWSKMNS